MILLENNTDFLQNYLISQGFLEDNESVVAAEIPGAGNMNYTLRIITNFRSFIIKQSRAYVEKYPQVAAPSDRCQRETEFYELIAGYQTLKNMTPEILLVDKINNIMVMTDLGSGSDFNFLYKGNSEISDSELSDIIGFASTLHTSVTSSNAPFLISNHQMRKLNHEHMFIYPFVEQDGFDLDGIQIGLMEIAKPYRADNDLKSEIEKLGDRYLADGNILLHGDYFPGSWLKTADGIKIIDPEFCFFGYAEFEIGVTIAHLMMSHQSDFVIQKALQLYQTKAALDIKLTMQCAGVEIMRRIMGLAQLPLSMELSKKAELLEKAKAFILK